MKYRVDPKFQERFALSIKQDLITASKYAGMHAMQEKNGMRDTKIGGEQGGDVVEET